MNDFHEQDLKRGLLLHSYLLFCLDGEGDEDGGDGTTTWEEPVSLKHRTEKCHR